MYNIALHIVTVLIFWIYREQRWYCCPRKDDIIPFPFNENRFSFFFFFCCRPPNIFEAGLKVNTKEYLDVLKSVVMPWWNQVSYGRPCMWQQDSTPAHKSKETQTWLQKECYDFAPFSHWSLNPLDYFVWSNVENITDMTSNNTKVNLITAIRRVFTDLLTALVEKACS